MKTKMCKGCGLEKPVSEFSPRKPTGYKHQCRPCRRTPKPAPGAPTPRIEVEQISQVEEHRLKVRVREVEAANRRLIADLSDAQAYRDVAAASVDARATVATIKPRERRSRLAEGTPLVLASDWHIEEEVRPEQVQGLNRYNLEISARRMERFFGSIRWANDFNRQAFQIRDMILWLGGDIITGFLHEDNVESNLLAPVEAIAYAYKSVKAGIEFLLADPKLERLVIPCNDGNHGRLTKKPRVATRTQNSIEWLLYMQLAEAFRGNPRVEFHIAASEFLYLEVYGRAVRFTHGDAAQYGGGIGGIMIPITKALHRWDQARRADLTAMGHWHQIMMLRHLLINGSLIGYNPYAQKIGASPEHPAQVYQMLDSRRFTGGISIPLHVSDLEDHQP